VKALRRGRAGAGRWLHAAPCRRRPWHQSGAPCHGALRSAVRQAPARSDTGQAARAEPRCCPGSGQV